MCGTFNICNPNEFHLWIPAGIQSIIEKYGGRPVSLLLSIVVCCLLLFCLFVCCLCAVVYVLFLLLVIMLLIIVFVIFSTGLLFYLQNMFVLLQKRRVGRFKRRSSSFIGDFGMSDSRRVEEQSDWLVNLFSASLLSLFLSFTLSCSTGLEQVS